MANSQQLVLAGPGGEQMVYDGDDEHVTRSEEEEAKSGENVEELTSIEDESLYHSCLSNDTTSTIDDSQVVSWHRVKDLGVGISNLLVLSIDNHTELKSDTFRHRSRC